MVYSAMIVGFHSVLFAFIIALHKLSSSTPGFNCLIVYYTNSSTALYYPTSTPSLCLPQASSFPFLSNPVQARSYPA